MKEGKCLSIVWRMNGRSEQLDASRTTEWSCPCAVPLLSSFSFSSSTAARRWVSAVRTRCGGAARHTRPFPPAPHQANVEANRYACPVLPEHARCRPARAKISTSLLRCYCIFLVAKTKQIAIITRYVNKHSVFVCVFEEESSPSRAQSMRIGACLLCRRMEIMDNCHNKRQTVSLRSLFESRWEGNFLCLEIRRQQRLLDFVCNWIGETILRFQNTSGFVTKRQRNPFHSRLFQLIHSH